MEKGQRNCVRDVVGSCDARQIKEMEKKDSNEY